jgi:hypothetical protein
MITKEDIKRMRRSKKSLLNQTYNLDIYSKFKIRCIERHINVKVGLDEAIHMWMKE